MKPTPQPAVGTPPQPLASLERTVAVRLLNIGRTGCLVESPHPLERDAVGMLQVSFGGDVYEDLVQVVRSQPVAGRGSAHRVGVTFLWSDAPGARSLRRLAHKLPAGATREASIVAMRGDVSS